VHFTGGLRHPDPSVWDTMEPDMRRSCAEIADKAQVSLNISLHTVIDSVSSIS
jgi:N-carbamoyl-L-amino-acid hydrolase